MFIFKKFAYFSSIFKKPTSGQYLTMPDFLCLRRNLPQEWLLGDVTVPNPVTATLYGEDGQVPGVPVASLAADSSLMNAILNSDKGEKHISLVGVEADIISSYVSLLCKGRLQIDENR